MSKRRRSSIEHKTRRSGTGKRIIVGMTVIAVAAILLLLRPGSGPLSSLSSEQEAGRRDMPRPERTSSGEWTRRAFLIDRLYRQVYTPCWEGAYGAIGEAYLFAATRDSGLYRFQLRERDIRAMCAGRWVDDRAWICMAELLWWRVTGKRDMNLVLDARRRYLEARDEGRLSRHEGFWSWYNWTPRLNSRDPIFTNSNMNQMGTAACWLFEATGESEFLQDALRVWYGDREAPGVESTLYRGNGLWQGTAGPAAFGKQLPWGGVEYCTYAVALNQIRPDSTLRRIVVSTVRRALDPANGWVDEEDFFQKRMDGNGVFVNNLLQAYLAFPEDLKEVPDKVERMLDHVWSNHHGNSRIVLHRESDDGIRNGWNPDGGEDGYGVDEVGTVHAQAEALRAFGAFAYVKSLMNQPRPVTVP